MHDRGHGTNDHKLLRVSLYIHSFFLPPSTLSPHLSHLTQCLALHALCSVRMFRDRNDVLLRPNQNSQSATSDTVAGSKIGIPIPLPTQSAHLPPSNYSRVPVRVVFMDLRYNRRQSPVSECADRDARRRLRLLRLDRFCY